MAGSVVYLSQNRPGRLMGMGHYERLLMAHIAALGASEEWRFSLVYDGRGGARSAPRAAALGFSTTRLGRLPWPAVRAVMTARLAGRRPDLYHSLALTFPAPAGRPAVLTIHDLPPARFPDEGVLPSWSGAAARAARAILAPSRFAKDEIVELLGVPPERVHVVYNGCEHGIFHAGVEPADAAALARLGIDGPFLAYVGGATRRKNVAGLLAAWRQVASRLPGMSLVLIGPEEALRGLARESGAPRVVVAGYLDRLELPAVLKAAHGLVCPSVYEGFGLPPLEAMALGVPVVAVRAGALPEVVGEAGLLVESGAPEALAVAMGQLIDDQALAARLRAAGPPRARAFDWDDHAAAVAGIYRQALGG